MFIVIINTLNIITSKHLKRSLLLPNFTTANLEQEL